ncbi:MAG: bifunctional DNA-formamidopyrimidine glycosylase/DNA-(apurinic or apyrimidinic site) lyase [Alphaproteobacteria bacterium]|nr:bifunctional DNA-formamidopyrimidine glycosylase/DNA-(apurinic or apyrimidinic site) lyase [Alphaproteobacteria bacterium]
MPELPEVETVCKGLARVLPNRKIVGVRQNRHDLRIPFPADLGSIKGRKVTTIKRRAKYILVHLDDGRTLIIHLGMSGQLTVSKKKYAAEKHDHLVLTLDNGAQVVFNDPRRFGLVALAKTKDLAQHKFFTHLGPEPFDKKFTAAFLAEKFKSKKVAVKLAIMDQTLVVGVGNIYASEALFSARIDPRRAAQSLKPEALKKLVTAVRNILKTAIRAGGSSLRDYVHADGSLGDFQQHFAVYGREGQKCRGCSCNIQKTGGVKRITQGGRSTFYCLLKQE